MTPGYTLTLSAAIAAGMFGRPVPRVDREEAVRQASDDEIEATYAPLRLADRVEDALESDHQRRCLMALAVLPEEIARDLLAQLQTTPVRTLDAEELWPAYHCIKAIVQRIGDGVTWTVLPGAQDRAELVELYMRKFDFDCDYRDFLPMHRLLCEAFEVAMGNERFERRRQAKLEALRDKDIDIERLMAQQADSLAGVLHDYWPM